MAPLSGRPARRPVGLRAISAVRALASRSKHQIAVHLDVFVHLEHAEKLAQSTDAVILQVESEISVDSQIGAGELDGSRQIDLASNAVAVLPTKSPALACPSKLRVPEVSFPDGTGRLP